MADKNILQRAIEWFRGAPPDVYAPNSLGPVGQAITGALPYGLPPQRGSRELAIAGKREPWLYAVTDKIGRSLSAVPWHLSVARDSSGNADPMRARQYNRFRAQITNTYEPQARKKWMRDLRREMDLEPVYAHPLLDLFDRPNPLQSGVQFRSLLARHMDLSGEIFLVKERNAFGMPVQLWPVPNFWCRLTPYYERSTFMFSYGLFMKELAETEVIWMKHLDLENPYARGTGAGFALADVIETFSYALKTEKAFYYNNGVPPIIASMDGANEDQVKAVREAWDQRHGGYWNAMKVAWVNFKLTIAQLTPKFADSQMLEQQNQKRDTIIQIYGVPPEVLGIVEHSNKASAVTSKGIYAEQVLVPRLEDQREIFQMQLVPEFDDSLILDYTSPMQDDREQDIETLSKVPNVLKVNEWRGLGGFDPHDDDSVGEKMYELPATAVDPASVQPTPTFSAPRALRAARGARSEGDTGDLSSEEIEQMIAALEKAGSLDDLASLTADTVKDFGDTFLSQVKDSYADGTVPDAMNMKDPNVKDYIEDQAGDRIADIDDTTKQNLRDYLKKAVEDGKSIDEMIDDLEADDNLSFGDSRSEVIARTEVLSASNFGTLEGYRQSGVVSKKGWMATPGSEGSRPSHEALDGTTLDLDDEFTDTATGATGQHPGGFDDPSSDCNCRCSIYAVVDDPETKALRVHMKQDHAAILAQRAPHEKKVQAAARRGLQRQRDFVVRALSKLSK